MVDTLVIEPLELNNPTMEAEERGLVNKITGMFRSSKKEKDKNSKDWQGLMKFYYGDQWDKPRPSWKSDTVVNFCYAVVESILPIMTDDKPRIVVLSRETSDTDISDIIGILLDRIWDINDMDIKLPEILKLCLKYGTSFGKTIWNDNNQEIEIIPVDPRQIYPDPTATSLDDAEWVIYAVYRNLEHIKRNYPERGGLVKGGSWLGPTSDFKKEVVALRQEVLSPVTTTDLKSQYFLEQPSGIQASDLGNQALLLECWFKPNSEYPDGRVVTIANGTVLADRPNPYNHKEFPFVRFICTVKPGQFWGMGIIEQLKKVNVAFNKTLCQISDILNYTANPILVIESNSGVDKTKVTNRPGNIITVREGSKVYWLSAPQIESGVFDLLTIYQRMIEIVSGSSDVTQGRKPTGITAGRAIQALQDAAQTRVRLLIRNMESSLANMGMQEVALLQQYYTDEKSIRITQPDRQGEVVKINELTPDGKINDVSAGKYDIEIVTGSTMPKNKLARFEEGTMLFDRGAFGNPESANARAELLDAADWPNKKEVVVNLKKEEEQMQQQAQQQQGQGQPQPNNKPKPAGNFTAEEQQAINAMLAEQAQEQQQA